MIKQYFLMATAIAFLMPVIACASEAEFNIEDLKKKLSETKNTEFHFNENDLQAKESDIDVMKESVSNAVAPDEKTKEALSKFKQHINSEKFKQSQQQWQESLGNKMNLTDWKKPEKADKPGQVIYSEKPILFISASIPINTLRQYAHDLEKVNGTMVIRGFIGGVGQLKPTIAFTDSVIKKNPSCSTEPCERYTTSISVDPIIFKEYQIKQVPALAVHGLTNLENYCNGLDGLNIGKNVVYGDFSVKHLLTRLAEQGGETEALKMVKTL